VVRLALCAAQWLSTVVVATVSDIIVHPRIQEAEERAKEHLLTAEAAISVGHELMRQLREKAWVAWLDGCWHCQGTGLEPYNGDWDDPKTQYVACMSCKGTGDLAGARLLDAYRIGRQEALGRLWVLQNYLGQIRMEPDQRRMEDLKKEVAK
jgi:hypothetical protein